MAKIKQQMVNPETGEALPWDQVQKGYEVEPGTFITLMNEEIEKTQPADSRDILVTKFVPTDQIHQQWYDRSYYLGPDDGSTEAYFALAEALEHKGREGIAHWVMRKKKYIAALRSEHRYLMLVTLNYAEEILTAADLPKPKGRAPDPKELKMAEQLISALEGEFRPEEFRDEYRERVLKFVEAKASGRAPKLKAASRKKAPKSLLASLTASVKMAKSKGEKKVA